MRRLSLTILVLSACLSFVGGTPPLKAEGSFEAYSAPATPIAPARWKAAIYAPQCVEDESAGASGTAAANRATAPPQKVLPTLKDLNQWLSERNNFCFPPNIIRPQ